MKDFIEYDNQSGRNNQWTNKKQFDYKMNMYKEAAKCLEETIYLLKNAGYNFDVDNLAVICEINYQKLYNYFKEHNYQFSHSMVENAVTHYFSNLLKEGLIIFANVDQKIINGDSDFSIEIAKHKKVSNKLLNFDLKKDIEEVIYTDLEYFLSKPRFGDLNNKDIDEINDELKHLDINKKIEYVEPRDKKEFSKEEIDPLEKEIIRQQIELKLMQVYSYIKKNERKELEENLNEKDDDNKRKL